MVQHYLVALVAVGMAVAFWSADRRSPTSIALAVGFAALGVAIAGQVMLFDPVLGVYLRPVSGVLAVFEGLSIAAMLEWVLRIRRTLPARHQLNLRFGDRALRWGQVMGGVYVGLSIGFPEWRLNYFLQAFGQHGGSFWTLPGFWLFAAPILAALLCGLVGILLLLGRRPDPAEGLRVIAMMVAAPFLVAGFVLPHDWAALTLTVGELCFLVGSVHYHVLQGQRGQFMRRFLSPQVAQLVAERGLDRAMDENLLEITVVACDLRGFTAYAESVPSQRVLQILREYYDGVGRVVGAFGATIKDFAGDGILILVGAPLPIEHHARCAIEMARQIRLEGGHMTRRWRVADHPLGIGIGVATGVVTVGVVDSGNRLEYTAVGATVNLATRLCAEAADGEILIDRRSIDLAGEVGVAARPPISVKGLRTPVPHFALYSETGAGARDSADAPAVAASA